MRVFTITSAFLIIATTISAEDVPVLNVGPVVNVMENLADNTVQIVEEIHSSLEFKVDRSADDLLGNIQVITANAMDQMSDTFYRANQKLPDCPQSWTLQELQGFVDEQLSNCTSNLYNLRTVFTGENTLILQGIQSYITELASIPASCELLNNPNSSATSFASSTACFVQKFAELNRNLGQLITQADTSAIRTRKLARSGVMSSKECTSKVVQYFISFMDEAFKNC